MSGKPKTFLEMIGWQSTLDLSDKPGLARALGTLLFALAIVVAALAILIIGHFLMILITGSSGNPNPRDEEIRNVGLVVAAVLGVPFVIWRSVVAQKQADTAQQSLITTQINQAVQGLGAEKLVKVLQTASDGSTQVVERSEPNIEVRVGAILSLERISENSPEDHIRIMEILCAYVRENACIVPIKDKPEGTDDWKQRTDTQMALSVLGRREATRISLEEGLEPPYRLDLRGANIQQSDMSQGAWQKALFQEALMAKAKLRDANLQAADLGRANLQEAYLRSANLQEANLGGANLQEANLWDANLQEANLWDANLKSADLKNWSSARTFLRSADFTDSQNLTQDAVNLAFGVKSGFGRTVLPEGLTYPDHWHAAAEAEEDNQELWEAAWEAYQAWLKTLPYTAS